MPSRRELPSKRWTSLDGRVDDTRARLQTAITTINKSALVEHAQHIKGQDVTMSLPFSVGQCSVCFELVAEDGTLIIAKVAMPHDPDDPAARSPEKQAYSLACEASTLQFVKLKMPDFLVPRVYAHEGPGSPLAIEVGAAYMLLEGLYGNTLQDVAPDLTLLSVNKLQFPLAWPKGPFLTKTQEEKQKHILAQWTQVQQDLAAITYPRIASICGVSTAGRAAWGRPADPLLDNLDLAGPLSDSIEYFTAVADKAIATLDPPGKLAAQIFRDIVQSIGFFKDWEAYGAFSLHHMDLSPHNILVDEELNFVAITGWGRAQTAPWQVNHFPEPFHLRDTVGEDPWHDLYPNVSWQERARVMYIQKFREAEIRQMEKGVFLGGSFAESIPGVGGRIFGCFKHLCRAKSVEWDVVRDLARWRVGRDQAEQYVQGIAAGFGLYEQS
ncbi:hypothetical protein CMUS01_14754 [Colletotrichum musicola]|uniref:Aminoglycoside phosphotransferase domain-containing protein n=1 Tax=Colletotrichum musicola TaxID=2175873 RepID=A0A8H6J1U7_9PEZI|nr:hypothetical protein CMUS01_14754 [Colletotrichum musicola]